MILSIVARALGAVVTVYMLLCMLRVFLTWMPRMETGKAGRMLSTLVDPYLGWFTRFRFLRAGRVDFSPVAGLAILIVLNQVLATLAFSGSITVGGILALLLDAIWSPVAFFLALLAVAALIRLIAYLARWNSVHPFWMTLDSLLNPVLFRLTRLVWRDRIVNYLIGLATGFGVLVFLRLGGDALIGLFLRLLRALPF